MTALRSALNPHSPEFTAAAQAMTAKLDELQTELAGALGGGGPKSICA